MLALVYLCLMALHLSELHAGSPYILGVPTDNHVAKATYNPTNAGFSETVDYALGQICTVAQFPVGYVGILRASTYFADNPNMLYPSPLIRGCLIGRNDCSKQDGNDPIINVYDMKGLKVNFCASAKSPADKFLLDVTVAYRLTSAGLQNSALHSPGEAKTCVAVAVIFTTDQVSTRIWIEDPSGQPFAVPKLHLDNVGHGNAEEYLESAGLTLSPYSGSYINACAQDLGTKQEDLFTMHIAITPL